MSFCKMRYLLFLLLYLGFNFYCCHSCCFCWTLLGSRTHKTSRRQSPSDRAVQFCERPLPHCKWHPGPSHVGHVEPQGMIGHVNVCTLQGESHNNSGFQPFCLLVLSALPNTLAPFSSAPHSSLFSLIISNKLLGRCCTSDETVQKGLLRKFSWLQNWSECVCVPCKQGCESVKQD